MNKKKIRKFTSLTFGLGVVSIIPAVLTSCSSISSSLLEEYVPKGTGLNLATGDNYSLTDLTKYSLSTNTGMEAWFKQIVNQAILQWYQRLGGDSSQSSDKVGYARQLSAEKKSINDSYDSAYDSTDGKNTTEKNYLFQQKELDPNGGTEDSWKKQKWLDWASTKLESDLFANLYLSLVDGNGNRVKTTYDALNKALSSNNGTASTIDASNNISFKFNKNALKGTSTSSNDNYVNNEYANFQQFIFDQWVQSENPFIINYEKWSYGTPSQGLDTIYNADAIGKTTTSTSTIAGSYAFPYFNTAADNSTYSDVNKFIQFVNSAKSSGIADQNDSSGTYGLTNINKGNFSGDTSASYKLVSNATSYSDLSASLALGATYLFSTSYTTKTTTSASSSDSTSTGVNNTSRNKLSKSVTTTTNGPFDAITSNFVSTSKDDFKNSSLSTISSSDSSSTYIPYTQLSDSLVKNVLSNNAYSLLSANNSNTGGNGTKSYSSSNGLYTIDAFIPNETNLKNVSFLRDTDGVYAITLDGEAYISKAATLSDAKKRAGDIVLYRYLESKMPSGAVSSSSGLTSIDLLSTLKTFYQNNRDWLIYEYAQSKSTSSSSSSNDSQSLFDFSFITSNANAKKVLNDISAYYYILNRYQKIESYQEAVYKAKSTYSSNYGSVANKNGLVSQFPYEFINASGITTSKAVSSTIGYYSQLSTLKVEQPSWWTTTSGSSIDWNDPNSTNGIRSTLMTDIGKYIDTISISQLTSSFSGFKYSQYIYTDDFFLNQAILAVGSDGNLLGDMIKKNILLSSINGNSSSTANNNILQNQLYIDSNSYNVSNFKDSSGGDSNTDVSKYINSALSNYFFNSTFDSSANKWVGLKQTYSPSYEFSSVSSQDVSTTNSSTSTLQTIKYDDLDTYRRNMWLSSNLTSTATTNDNYINFLTFIATIQYLNANDGEKFMEQLRNKISTNDGSNLSFLVWESSVDKNLDNSTSFATTNTATQTDTTPTSSSSSFSNAKTLLYGFDGKSMVTNVNNSQSTSYYPNKSNTGTYVDKNNNNSTFTDSSLTANYYTHVSGMHGFQGVETSTSSSNISSVLSNALFTSPSLFSNTTSSASSTNNDKTGVLYGIAKDRNQLKTNIKTYSSSQVDNLAKLIQKYFNIDISSVLNASDESSKQSALIKIVESSSSQKIPDSAFTPRRGYVNGGSLYKEDNQSVTNVNYGSYVIQLNSDDLKDKSTFITTLQNTFSNNNPNNSSTTISTTDSSVSSNAKDEAASLYWNLLVQIASDSSVQDVAISSLLSGNKITVYDVRLNNQLGSKWVINYKEQSSS